MIAVILVGGLGTRLRPLTLTMPKPMLPVANRPFLEHQLDHLAAHGIDRVILACGYEPDALRAYFGDRVEYVVEDHPLGTAGAIAHAAAGLDETFVACNGDVLTDVDITALVAAHRSAGARATIALHTVDDPRRYGVVVTAADGAVRAFVEKPEGVPPAHTINAGTYVLEPDVLALVAPDVECSIEREVFPQLVGDGLYGGLFDTEWIDIGTPDAYLRANLAAAGPAGVVAPDATIGTGAYVEGSVVGARAHIGAGARVVQSVVLPGGRVEPAANLERVVVNEQGIVW